MQKLSYRWAALGGLFVFSLHCSYLLAADFGPSAVINLPSARFTDDGAFTLGYAEQSSAKSASVSYQALPWLEASFRYSSFKDFSYYDHNYELKAHLLQEAGWLPAVAVGVRDVADSSVFASEYLVASKALGDFDVSFGLGWGQLAGDDAVGVFGGVRYTLSEEQGLRLLAEYGQDDSLLDAGSGELLAESNASYGVEWQPLAGLSLTLSRQHQREWGFGVQLALDSKKPTERRRPEVMPARRLLPDEPFDAEAGRNDWQKALMADLERVGIDASHLVLSADGADMSLQLANRKYAYWPDAIEQAQVLVGGWAPESVGQITYVIEEDGLLVQSVVLPRVRSRAQVATRKSVQNARVRPVVPSVDNDEGEAKAGVKQAGVGDSAESSMDAGSSLAVGDKTDWFDLELTLDNRVLLLGSQAPLAYQFYAKAATQLELSDHWRLLADYDVDLLNNVEDMRYESDSQLPHVRSDMLRYLQEGDQGFSRVLLEARGTTAANLHYRAYVGVLETMYSGVGGELLYSPYKSRLALSVSANWVKQRDYDLSFSHLDYSTSTAFVSAFWASPFHNYDFALYVGRYLAKDVGATLEVRRTFNNGWMVGAWLSATDGADEIGGLGGFDQSSRDQGIFFRIPLGDLGSQARSAYTARIRPVQRDVGARLEEYSGQLWWDLRQARYDVFKGGR